MIKRAAIEFRDLSLRYGTRRLFDAFNAAVAPGEHVALSGPSGTGKSSILFAMLGFTSIASGMIDVQGLTVNARNIGRIRAQVAYVPQQSSTAVIAPGSVQDFFDALFKLRANRGRKPTRDQIAASLAQLALEPTTILGQSTRVLSGGEKQRVALAAALLMKRPLLILDEPSAALDADARDRVLAAIGERSELTVLSVSHDSAWLAACDREIQIQTTRS